MDNLSRYNLYIFIYIHMCVYVNIYNIYVGIQCPVCVHGLIVNTAPGTS